MRVVVGSENPTKVDGVRMAFEQFFSQVEVVGVGVKCSVPSQPFNEDTIKGAVERAIKAYRDEFDFSVGVEAGLFAMPNTLTGYIDFQVAAIYDGERITVGFGPGFEFPPTVVARALEGDEVGRVMSELTGIEDIGRKKGAIHYLTKGAISRAELTKLAVTMALIPRINRKLYEL